MLSSVVGSGSGGVGDGVVEPTGRVYASASGDYVLCRDTEAASLHHSSSSSSSVAGATTPSNTNSTANNNPASNSSAISPPIISSQDLIQSSAASHPDMPVSSSAFPWSSGEQQQQHQSQSIQQSQHQHSLSSASRGGASNLHPLTDWTHFESVPSDVVSSDETHNLLLKQLWKENPDASESSENALLRQILSEKPNQEDTKEIRLLLGDPFSSGMSQNGSPNNNNVNDPANLTQFLENLNNMSSGGGTGNTSNPSQKRKIEELDGAETGNPAKLSEKNKMLAALLQSTPRGGHGDIPAAGLPTPNPGDLPQNKLPKDLPSRILPAVGQQQRGGGGAPFLQQNGMHHRNGGGSSAAAAAAAAGGLCEFITMDNSLFASRSGITHADTMDIFDLIGELQDSDLGASDPLQNGPLTPIDKQAIDNIRQSLLVDYQKGPSLSNSSNSSNMLLSEGMPYRDQPMPSPGSMIPKYNISQGGPRPPPMHSFPNNGDMLRLPGPGGHMMLPNHVSPPSRPGPGIPQEFSNSRSPAPPTQGSNVRQQIRMNSLSRQGRTAQQGGSGSGGMGFNMGQPGANMQMPNAPNVTVGRSYSIPNAGPHGGFGVNGYQNVPQNTQRFSGQQTVPYSSPPPPNMQFQVPGSNQPLSPRLANSQGGVGRMTRPPNGMWMQQGQMGNPMQGGGGGGAVGNPMNLGGGGGPQQQNPPPYSNQQFMNQQQANQNFQHSQMMQQQGVGQAAMQRFPGPGSAAFQQQQGMMQQQQQDAFGNGGGGFYPRGMGGGGGAGGQPRMALSRQNSQLMQSSLVNNLADDLRANDGAFGLATGGYQVNGVNSAPTTANVQQQQFQWNMNDRQQQQGMSAGSTPGGGGVVGMNGGNASRIPAPPSLDPSFQHFDSFFDSPANNGGVAMNGLGPGGGGGGGGQQPQHLTDQQQFRLYANDANNQQQQQNANLMNQMQQQLQQQNQNQQPQLHSSQFAPLSTSGSCGELLGISGTHQQGNSPGHQQILQPGDRSKSLLQQLLSENG
ncbi:hypothetical protein BV898_18757 [Hypsibius exemplaris]|uniref:Uncharacterized protein n=1 Tax=Hypsibius exemplaris TaxID=2072580 RepID=A0A9X6RNB0_HYPEX|nr:hypothetical protein BV898_18757 [Hypsibius exemplaris]